MPHPPLQLTVEAEESVYSGRYSNNGACPMWCFNNNCVVRVGGDVFVSGYERIPGDAIPTPRFHLTPGGRRFVVYYVTDGQALSENRILEIHPDGTASAPVTLPLKYPLTQFFTASPRAGCAPADTLDLLGHRRGGWRPREGTDYREWEGTMSYARVRIQ